MRGNSLFWQFLGVAVFLAAAGLQVAFRYMREQAARKRAEDARRRRDEELLRTGRDPRGGRPGDDDERRRREAVIARRQAELEELRRRQAASSGGTAADVTGPPGGILIQIPGVPGPVIVRPIPRAQRPPGATSSPAVPGRSPAGAPSAARPKRPGRSRPVPSPSAARPARATAPAVRAPGSVAAPASSGLEHPSPGSIAPAVTPPPELNRSIVSGVLMSPEDWRRAIMMHEILSPPLALRDPDDAP